MKKNSQFDFDSYKIVWGSKKIYKSKGVAKTLRQKCILKRIRVTLSF